MAEYIDLEDAITITSYAIDEHPYKEPGRPETYCEYNEGWNDACDYIRAKLESAHTADVVPVVHGEWILKHIGAGHYWECSVCHKTPCIYVTPDTKFCPNCGAKMNLNP